MARHHAPVQPTHFVVLAVGVVVALLGAGNFVALAKHGNAVRAQQNGGKLFSLPRAQFVNGRVVGGAFHAAIPTVVGVGAVGIVLAVGEIVFLVIGNQIVEHEATWQVASLGVRMLFAPPGMIQNVKE